MTKPTENEDLEIRKRRILFRAWHRGTREMDLILGRFVNATVPGLNEREISLLERLMEVPDPDLYGWITGAKETPEEYETAVLQSLRSFHFGGEGWR